MKREHRLRYIIKEGLLDTFYIWKDELRNVFKDAGVMIFFFLVPFVYPLLYSFIYNNEVVHEAKMVVVDQSDSTYALSPSATTACMRILVVTRRSVV